MLSGKSNYCELAGVSLSQFNLLFVVCLSDSPPTPSPVVSLKCLLVSYLAFLTLIYLIRLGFSNLAIIKRLNGKESWTRDLLGL